MYWEVLSPFLGNGNGRITQCNQFYLTVDGGTYQRCFPIGRDGHI